MDENQKYELRAQIKALEKKLADLKLRWPAHSLKPAMMVELEDLEEERERLKHNLISQ